MTKSRTILGAAALVIALPLAGCTGDPVADNAAIGAVGGAAMGGLLGGSTRATIAGAGLGAVAGGIYGTTQRQSFQRPAETRATRAHPCQDIFDSVSHPEARADLCEARLGGY